MTKAKSGMLPGYETTFITRAEMADAGLQTLRERIQGIVTEFGGNVILNEDWGKRKLAYAIGKEQRGHYTYLAFTAKPGVVHEIERNLRLNEHVLRFLSVNLGKHFEAETFAKKRADLQAAAKKREEEREARREERMAERRGEYRERTEYRDRGDRGEGRKHAEGEEE